MAFVRYHRDKIKKNPLIEERDYSRFMILLSLLRLVITCTEGRLNGVAVVNHLNIGDVPVN